MHKHKSFLLPAEFPCTLCLFAVQSNCCLERLLQLWGSALVATRSLNCSLFSFIHLLLTEFFQYPFRDRFFLRDTVDLLLSVLNGIT